MTEQPKKTENTQQTEESLDLKKKEIAEQNLKERLLSVLADLDSIKILKSLLRDLKRDLKNITKKQIINVFLFFIITGSIAAYAKWTEVPKLCIFGDTDGIEVYLNEKKLELGEKIPKGESSFLDVWIDKGLHTLRIKKSGKELLQIERLFSVEKLYFVYVDKENKWLKMDSRNCKYSAKQKPNNFYYNTAKLEVDGKETIIHFPDERNRNQGKVAWGYTFGISTKPSLITLYKKAQFVFPHEAIPKINSSKNSEWRVVLRYMTNGEQSFCEKLIQKGKPSGS